MMREFQSLRTAAFFLLFSIFCVYAAPVAGQTDNTRPTIVAISPGNYSLSLDIGLSVSATFSEGMNPATINSSTFQLKNALTGSLVSSTIVYNASTRRATLYPSSPLNSLLYSVKVKGGSSGVKDIAGNYLANDYNWLFILIPLWDFSAPAVVSVSPANGATNVATSANIMANFSEGLNASSVNTSNFELRNPANVLVPATVSYSSSLKRATLDPVSALSSATTYRATLKGGNSGIRDPYGNALPSNYTWTFTTASPADNTPPVVSSVNPANNQKDVSISAIVSAVFNEPMNASTINANTVKLFNSHNTPVAASLSYNPTARTVSLTPASPLAYGNVYKAIIKGGSAGVKDVAGNAMQSDHSWTFTTVPVTIFQPTDAPAVPLITGQPVELGVKFRSSQPGFVLGIRFYKGAGNDGTHIGHLWSNTGNMMAEATFVNETASGWQQVLFSNPVSISPGTTYIASYHSSLGHYSYTNNYFVNSVSNGPLKALADGEEGGNGVFAHGAGPIFPNNSYLSTNYYADVVFAADLTPDNTSPTIESVFPADGGVDVPVTTNITAVFSEAMEPATINNTTVELRKGNTAVSATISYSVSSNAVSVTPAAPLSQSTTYSVIVKGGNAGAKDLAGNPLQGDKSWSFTTAEPLIAADQGPGGPILVISSAANPFSRYTVEILKAEGLNHFSAADVSAVLNGGVNLAQYDVIILGQVDVTEPLKNALSTWVNGGRSLIAFKPGSMLNSLTGLSAANGTLSDKYLLVNTSSGPGVGIVGETIQFHGTADLHTITPGSNTVSLATLYSDEATATAHPAVTMRTVGSNGRVFTFTYDLPRSIVYTRQGNPEWAGQKRDGQIDPIRANDMFFPDWIDFDKVHIPQADEQQRLLANIILQSNLHRKPLPRFWYLPRDLKAAIVMTGDDHANGGTPARFAEYMDKGPNSPQDVADWKAIRSTSYIFPYSSFTNAQAAFYQSQGFEIALHPTTNCENFTPASLEDAISSQLGNFRSTYPGISSPATNRTHCMPWTDWATHPKVQLQNGIRFDVNYYYWHQDWTGNRPGMFTGSAMPMRFADLDGTIIDVYQAPTQMTDETEMNYTEFSSAVLDKALGAEGYYGVFTANMHTDVAASAGSDAIIATALARGVPVISAKQMLTWLDARNSSSFGNFNWNSNTLTFTVTARHAAINLKAMLPFNSGTGLLMSITREGANVPFTQQVIKGIEYAFFPVTAGTHNYVATYSATASRTDARRDTALATVAPQVTEEGRTAGEKPAADVETAAAKLQVKAMPNPSTNYFNLSINGTDANPVTVRVFDISGRIVEVHQGKPSSIVLRLGEKWTAGSYFAEIVQGNERKVIKLIKAN